MKGSQVNDSSLSQDEYWKLLGKLIVSADLSAVTACLGWIIFWLDHIPGHVIHLHWMSPLLFLASMSAALYAARIVIRTGNRLGAPRDRIWHNVEIVYGLFASGTGIAGYLLNPPF